MCYSNFVCFLLLVFLFLFLLFLISTTNVSKSWKKISYGHCSCILVYVHVVGAFFHFFTYLTFSCDCHDAFANVCLVLCCNADLVVNTVISRQCWLLVITFVFLLFFIDMKKFFEISVYLPVSTRYYWYKTILSMSLFSSRDSNSIVLLEIHIMFT